MGPAALARPAAARGASSLAASDAALISEVGADLMPVGGAGSIPAICPAEVERRTPREDDLVAAGFRPMKVRHIVV